MNILFALMLFTSLNAPVDLAMLDLDMEPDIRVTLNAPSGAAAETYYLLTQAGDTLITQAGDTLTQD